MIRRAIPLVALFLLALFILVANTRTQAQSSAGLVINEVFDSATPALEFFELYNTSSSDIDLSSYEIYNSSGSDSLAQLDQPVIRAGEFRAVPASTFTDATIGGTTSLQYDGDFLALVKTDVSDEIVDIVNWNNANPNWPNYQRFQPYFFFPPAAMITPDSSMDLQRFPDGLDTNRASDFVALHRSPSDASCDDPLEDDSNFSDAKPLPLDQPQIHRICAAGDTDVVRLFLQNTFTYTLDVYSLESALDLKLTLYDPLGNVLAVGSGTNPTLRTIVFRPTNNDIYFASVTEANGGGGSGSAWLYQLLLVSQELPTATPTLIPTPQPYTDVATTDYFYEALHYLTEHAIISGYSDAAHCAGSTPCFQPYFTTTRGQLIKMVVLANGLPLAVPTFQIQAHFSDVPTSDPFYLYIEQATAARIVTGYDSTAVCGPAVPCFLPYKEVTRGQLAKIVATAWRWNKVAPATPTFADVGFDNPFFSYIEMAACHNVINGYEDGTFRPDSNARRGQIAKIIYGAMFSPQNCTP